MRFARVWQWAKIELQNTPIQNQEIAYENLNQVYSLYSLLLTLNTLHKEKNSVQSLYWGRKLHISPKVQTCPRSVPEYLCGNQWWDDHHLHKFGKTPEDTQHPTTQQQTYRSPINVYTKKGSSKLCSLMNTLTSFKLIKFWQKGLVQKSNMNSVVRLWQQC
jgi:hypothetical protein